MAYSGWSAANRIRCASALVTAAPMTIAAWVKPASLAVQIIGGIFNSANANNGNVMAFELDASGHVIAYAGNNAATTGLATTTTTLSAGAWGHAAGVFTSTTSRAALLNGGGKGTNVTSIAAPTSPNRTSIGLRDNAADDVPFTGSIAEFGLWNVALDDAEVASLAAGFSPLLVRPQSLIAYVPLVRDLLDIRGNAFAVVGSLSQADHSPVFNPS